MFIKDELPVTQLILQYVSFQMWKECARRAPLVVFKCEGSLPTEFLWFRSVKLNHISAVASSLTVSRPHSEY